MTSLPICIQDAVVSYSSKKKALRDISLDVASGEFLGVIGPNGAGKSSLLKLVNGLLRPSEGSVQVLGASTASRSFWSMRKRIGYVAQDQAVDPRLPISVRESVLVGSYGRLGFFNKIPLEVYDSADELISFVGLKDLQNRPLGHVSGGERQRVAIARTLLQEPKILLLDEPTANLDINSQKDILGLIQKLHQKFACTTIMVTHDLNTLPGNCTKVALLKAGQILWQGNTPEAFNEDLLKHLYDTEVSFTERNGRCYVLF